MNNKKLLRSTKNRSILGVCGGLADFFGISPLGVRLIFIFTMPLSLIIYIILANSIDDTPCSL
ncbi:PspC domain-containing protein [Salisediminibacterium beveridgei]|uniref:PspC domain-containing protein n=1 Tax=Salisediminibacterium beveridgei TaxID=632773 RepID=UPI000A041109|nr:PspC domain-containing protein [Salisediminibacterium beveridgei]